MHKLTKLFVIARLYASTTPGRSVWSTTDRNVVAPVAMMSCALAFGAYLLRAEGRVLSMIVSARERKIAPPKYWKKKIEEVATATSSAGSKDWTAVKGYWSDILVEYYTSEGYYISMHTICITDPRPIPVKIWYPIQLPGSVQGRNVDIMPAPIALSRLPNSAHGVQRLIIWTV